MPISHTIGPQVCTACHGKRCTVCHQTGFGPQYFAYASTADIIGYGGAAGGGKSFFAYTKPWLRKWTDDPSWQGVYFRQSLPDLRRSVWPKARLFGIRMGSIPRQHPLQLQANSGATLDFFGVDRLQDIEEKFDGAELPYVVFDEAQHYDEACPRFFFTRQRSTSGARSQLVLTFNPGGRGQQWLFRWFAPWLDPKFPVPAGRYEKRFFFDSWDDNGAPVFEWFSQPGQLIGKGDRHPITDQKARSIIFIGARLEDNPALTEADPEYENRMRGTDRVTYEQKRHGNFLIRHTAGTTFNRDMFSIQQIVGRLPDSMVRRRVRYWDRAGSEGKGDFTAGVLMALLHGPTPRYVMEDVIAVQWSPDKVEDLIWSCAGVAASRTALEAKLKQAGQWGTPKGQLPLDAGQLPKDPPGTVVAGEQDPAQAGKAQAEAFLREARRQGLAVRVYTQSERGSKYSSGGTSIAPRMQPMAISAQNGQISLKRASWNDRFLDRAQAFDGDENGGLDDDQIDAATGAHDMLLDYHRHGRFTMGRDR